MLKARMYAVKAREKLGVAENAKAFRGLETKIWNSAR
jgi:hypothetical protein